MRFLKRRKIEQYNPVDTSPVEKELYQGCDIQFLFLDTNEGAGTLEFSIEINGVQVYNGTLLQLNEENGLLYGFNSNFTTGKNKFVGLLELKQLVNGGVSVQQIKSVKIKSTGGTATLLDITVGEIIDIN